MVGTLDNQHAPTMVINLLSFFGVKNTVCRKQFVMKAQAFVVAVDEV